MRIFAPATSGRYTQQVTVSFVADVRELQNVWELSGQFEGDIVLSERQLKNGLIDVVQNGVIDANYRWPHKTVPLYIDPMFSEYCSNKLQSGMRGVELNIHALQVPPRKRPN